MNLRNIGFAKNHTGDYGVEGIHNPIKAAENSNLTPLDLKLTHPQVTKRGLPVIASKETSDSLIERLNRISKNRYHTEIVYENQRLTLKSLT